jgi:hypothetical protein
MGWASRIARPGPMTSEYKILGGKPEFKRSLRSSGRRWDDTIKMKLVDCIHLTQNRTERRDILNTVKAGNFLTSWASISFQGRLCALCAVKLCSTGVSCLPSNSDQCFRTLQQIPRSLAPPPTGKATKRAYSRCFVLGPTFQLPSVSSPKIPNTSHSRNDAISRHAVHCLHIR